MFAHFHSPIIQISSASILGTLQHDIVRKPKGLIPRRPHAASVLSTSLIQYEVPYTIASSLKL